MKHYFNRFPVVAYDGQAARNILARVAFDLKTRINPANFGSVRLEDDVSGRADIIAENYYGAPTYDWLLYLSNDIVDPYNDMFRDSESFYKFIVSKYGTIQYAQDKILFYINNWSDNPDDKLTIAQFEAASQVVKNYYTATVDYQNQVIGYERKKVDWIKSTNKLQILTLDTVDMLLIGSIVIQKPASVVTASGEIVDIDRDTNKITIQHIQGEFDIAGAVKRYNTTFSYDLEAIEEPHTENNISDDEAVFWSPMTAYAYESELNEAKRTIKLLRASLKNSAEEQLTDLMRS